MGDARYNGRMATRSIKKTLERKGAAAHEKRSSVGKRRRTAAIARFIADTKEQARVLLVDIEKKTFAARRERARIEGMKMRLVGIEDANERSKTAVELAGAERQTSDLLFKLAEHRSHMRRLLRTCGECEEELARQRKRMQAALS